MSTLSQQSAAVKPQNSATFGVCPGCGIWIDKHGRCNCNSRLAAGAIEWVVADSTGIDLAAQWGHEDATEGKRRGGDMFTFLSPEYHSYHAAYNAGLRLLNQLTGDVSQAALAECAWFEEIGAATRVAAGKAAAHVGGAGYARLSPEAQAACDAEQAAMRDDVHMFEVFGELSRVEWIGREQFEMRGAW